MKESFSVIDKTNIEHLGIWQPVVTLVGETLDLMAGLYLCNTSAQIMPDHITFSLGLEVELQQKDRSL